MRNLLVVLSVLMYLSAGAQSSGTISQVWVSDNGDGSYKNPVLHADYSDPDVIRIGSDYYLTASSFNCSPGLPILHSKDLVNWQLINHALPKQIPEELFSRPQHGKGVWAPAFSYHNGELFIYYPDPDFGIYRVKTKDPTGKWSNPELVLAGKGIIDPSVFWDDDGQAYLAVAWAATRAGVNSLLTLFKLNKEGNKVIDEGKHIYDGHGLDHTVEGPKFFKKDGFYYLFPPAGGVTTGWQLALRSKNIYGPYERKVVMDQGSSRVNGPHQGAMVQTQTGEYWFFHFQDKGAYGRILHLQPVTWKNNWPVIGRDDSGDGKGEPVGVFKKPNVGKRYPVMTPAESDEFNSDRLGHQWQWYANASIQWSALMPGSGYLRLFAMPADSGVNMWNVPNLLLQKLPAENFTGTAKITYTTEWDCWQGKKAGLIVMGNDYAYLSIAKDSLGYFLSQVVCKDAINNGNETVVAHHRLKGATAYLSVKVTGPDAICRFSYSEDGITFQPIGEMFTATQERWIGAKLGLFCVAKPEIRIGGYADVDWFRVTKNQ